MGRLFDYDGPVMRIITKIAYSAYLNVLWLVCCLPVFTVGASTTALFYVTVKIARNEEGGLTRAFFRSFKQNFRQATVIWLIMLVLGIVLGIDGYVFYHMRFSSALWTVGTAAFLVALAAYFIVLMYIFPLLSYFENTTRAMFKNAIMIGMRFLLCTVMMAAIYFAMILVVVRIFTPAVVFGEGLCALLCSYLLSNILRLCEGRTDGEAENEAEAGDIEDAEAVDEEIAFAGTVSNATGDGKTGVTGAVSGETASAGIPAKRDALAETKKALAEAKSGAAGTKKGRMALFDLEDTDGMPGGLSRLRELKGKKKLEYLWDYYKLPIFTACLCVYVAGYLLYGHFTKKETFLYAALVNIEAGDELSSELGEGFIDYAGDAGLGEQLELYRGLYLTDDADSEYYGYQEATRTRIVGSIDREALDVVIMNKEAFDMFAYSGYLLDIETFLKDNSPDLYARLGDRIVSNTVLLNRSEASYPSGEVPEETEEYPMGLDLSDSPVIMRAGLDGTAYLGIIANTPRAEAIIAYLEYLYGAEAGQPG